MLDTTEGAWVPLRQSVLAVALEAEWKPAACHVTWYMSEVICEG